MLNAEARKREKGEASSSDAYVAESHGRENRGRSQGKQHGKDQKSRGRSKSRQRHEVTCFYCGKPNHKKVDCRKYKRDLAEGKIANKNEQKGENGAAMTAECVGEDYLVIEDEECYSDVRDDAMSWVVDSGASFHITSDEEYYTSYTDRKSVV